MGNILMAKTYSIKLPFVKRFSDYHEIDNLEDTLNSDGGIGKKIKSHECGFVAPYYLGLFYTGKRPSKAEILKMIRTELGYSEEDLKEIDCAFTHIYSKMLKDKNRVMNATDKVETMRSWLVGIDTDLMTTLELQIHELVNDLPRTRNAKNQGVNSKSILGESNVEAEKLK